MRFTDNAELTAANMANADILAGTDVSASTDKKFTLSGLADWFLNRFTGLSLAGKNQSVKSALDELNSTTVSITAGSGVSVASNNSVRIGKLVAINAYFQCDSVTAGTALTVGMVDASSKPAKESAVVGFDNYSRQNVVGWITANGDIRAVPPATASNRSLRLSFCYMAK